MRIACIGEAMIELALQHGYAQIGVAGDTLNTAIYLKRGAPELAVEYITCLGDDAFSDRIADFIAAQGIGTAAIRRLPGASPGLYAISTNAAGERSFTYWRDTSAARQLFAAGDFAQLEGYDALYLSGISLAILPHAVRLALLDWLRQSPAQVIYDNNHRPRLWENAAAALQITRAMWDRADIALPSLEDEMVLSEETPAEITRRFATHPGRGALKRGSEGPLSIGEAVAQDYPPAGRVVDTTAAGDSFNGGYMAALFRGASQAEALMAGHRLAIEVIQHRGAIVPG